MKLFVSLIQGAKKNASHKIKIFCNRYKNSIDYSVFKRNEPA